MGELVCNFMFLSREFPENHNFSACQLLFVTDENDDSDDSDDDEVLKSTLFLRWCSYSVPGYQPQFWAMLEKNIAWNKHQKKSCHNLKKHT